jgi:hypothetical protein
MRRVVAAFVALGVAAGLALVGLGVSSATGAAVGTGTAPPAPTFLEGVTGESCLSSTWCMVVGYGSDYGRPAQADVWNGTALVPLQTPVPGPLGSLDPDAVSCTSTRACLAVGSHYSEDGDQTLAESWNGTSWTRLATPNPGESADFLSVSCMSAGHCMAVGYFDANNTDGTTSVPLAMSWNGAGWSMLSAAGSGTPLQGSLTGVSCTSTSSCVAVGFEGGPSGNQQGSTPLAESWNGRSWTVVRTPVPSGVEVASLSDVSCASQDVCEAVGQYGTAVDAGAQALTERWDGSSWTVQGTPGASGELSGVSCGSTTDCIAVGESTQYPASTFAERWDGARWTVLPTPDQWQSLLAISCVASSCFASGMMGQALASSVPSDASLLETWDGAAWTVRVPSPIVGLAPTPDAGGYWLATAGGTVYPFADAPDYGNLTGLPAGTVVVGIVSTPDRGGYWLVTNAGGVYPFGDAKGYGSMLGHVLTRPVVGMASTPDGAGYWLVASDGGVFAFGDARYLGSMGGQHLNKPIVGMAADETTGGYWLVAADGGVFAFHAPFYGSTGGIRLAKPIVGVDAAGAGYRFVASDGGVFAFKAPFSGSLGGTGYVTSVTAMTSDGSGYWLVQGNGAVTGFGGASSYSDCLMRACPSF